MICIVKGHGEIYLASETGRIKVLDGRSQPSVRRCCLYYLIYVRQGKILCLDVFSIADSSVLAAFRKLEHVPLKDRT